MLRYRVSFCLREPILVPHGDPGAGVHSSDRVISGRRLIGSMFSEAAARGKEAQLSAAVSQPGVRIGNALPTEHEDVIPVPRSLRTCKTERWPGKGSHSISDVLLGADSWDCGHCGSPLVLPKERFVRKSGNAWVAAKGAAIEVSMRTALRKRVTIEGGIFSQEALSASDSTAAFDGQYSATWIVPNDACWAALSASTGIPEDQDNSTPFFLRVGGDSAVRGLIEGRVTRREPVDVGLLREQVDERLTASAQTREDGGFLFTLTLASAAIMLDQWQRYITRLTPSVLFGDCELASCVTPLSGGCYAEVRSIGGWASRHRLPLASDIAIAEGSAYAFRCPDRLRSALTLALAGIWMEGIGIRRTEGYGAVEPCHPIHSELGSRS